MTTSTLTVTEFVTARIAEDEQRAKMALLVLESVDGGGSHWRANDNGNVWEVGTNDCIAVAPFGASLGAVGMHIALHDPARVLAQCAAMRKIVEAHPLETRVRAEGCMTCNWDRDYLWDQTGPCDTLRALASIWSDDPDWREEWR
jgi:hypothetical protein